MYRLPRLLSSPAPQVKRRQNAGHGDHGDQQNHHDIPKPLFLHPLFPPRNSFTPLSLCTGWIFPARPAHGHEGVEALFRRHHVFLPHRECRNAPFSVRNSNSLLTSVFPLLTNRESVRLTPSSVSATITCAMDSLLPNRRRQSRRFLPAAETEQSVPAPPRSATSCRSRYLASACSAMAVMSVSASPPANDHPPPEAPRSEYSPHTRPAWPAWFRRCFPDVIRPAVQRQQRENGAVDPPEIPSDQSPPEEPAG